MKWMDDSAGSFTVLQLLVDSLPAYISFVDAEERYRLVNRRYEEYIGPTAEKLVGQRLSEVHQPADYAEMQPHVRQALAGQPAHYQINPTSPAGKSHWFDVQYIPRTRSDGTVLGFFVLGSDITELKQAEAALRDSQVRLETLVCHLPGMAYRCQNDPDWTMTFVSDGCEALTGYRRDELEGNRSVSYGTLVHPEDATWLWAKCQASLDARIPCQNEYRILDRQGHEHWVSERASGVYAADGTLLCIDGFIQDITASRQAKLDRDNLERKMLETQKLESLGVLAGGIAHDFNNILTGILGNASLGLMSLPPGSPAEENLNDITEAAFRAADLCKQMLAYSGKGRFVVERLDLGRLVEATTQMIQLSISKKAVLRLQLAPQLPPIEADATQLRQVIMNLVINASEAIGEKSGVISISTGVTRIDRPYLAGTVTTPELPEGDYVFLEVSDSGCGMTPETQTRIFDPFFTTKFTGRGLGLAAVLGIIRGHKGALKVYTEPGRGTTFKLLFPAVTGPLDPALIGPVSSTDLLGPGTVLVIDDEETIRTTIARMLRHMGLEAVLAPDGREALELFRADPDRFALVLCDLTMPHLDGEQTFMELRRLRPGVQVVLMSGFSQQEALVRFTGKGLASFLQKPFSFEALREVLQAALA
ncbi:MAG: PAS domain S-box protein [Gemmatimonadota bacterium]|nr:PAS domain S-box protein [Gemmatimonadota bacterium]